MEFSNKLLMSLRQDIKVLNNIIKDISKKVTSDKLCSWLYPTKSFSDIPKIDFIEDKPKENTYLNYLEFIIDRLFLIINLFIVYIEQFPNTLKSQNSTRNVTRPNNLSLSAVTNLFWTNLTHLNETIRNYEMFQNRTSTYLGNRIVAIHKNIQTDSYTPTHCNSCSIAETCIKEIVNELEKNSDANFIRKTRKDLQEDIFSITQCGCMNRLTTAITQDITCFIKQIKDTKKENQNNNLKIEELTAKYSDSLNIIKDTQIHIKKMRKRSASAKQKSKNLAKDISFLMRINKESESQLMQERKKVIILEKSIQENVTTVALLSTNNEKLGRDIKECLQENVNLSDEMSLWKDRFSEIYLENRNLQSQIEELKTDVESLKNIAKSCQNLTKKLDHYNVRILERSKNFLNKFKNLTNTIDVMPKMQGYKTMKNKEDATFIRDPVADMKNQMEINRLNIEQLEKHNLDLLNIIQRIEKKVH